MVKNNGISKRDAEESFQYVKFLVTQGVCWDTAEQTVLKDLELDNVHRMAHNKWKLVNLYEEREVKRTLGENTDQDIIYSVMDHLSPADRENFKDIVKLKTEAEKLNPFVEKQHKWEEDIFEAAGVKLTGFESENELFKLAQQNKEAAIEALDYRIAHPASSRSRKGGSVYYTRKKVIVANNSTAVKFRSAFKPSSVTRKMVEAFLHENGSPGASVILEALQKDDLTLSFNMAINNLSGSQIYCDSLIVKNVMLCLNAAITNAKGSPKAMETFSKLLWVQKATEGDSEKVKEIIDVFNRNGGIHFYTK
jgi:hypothetical protein